MRAVRAWVAGALFGLIAGGGAGAQTSYVQIEAQPTRAEAEMRARAYAGAFDNVRGFRLPSGWYAIALGPYERAEAAARLTELRRERLIPADSFLAPARSYGAPFWPPEGEAAGAGPAAGGAAGGGAGRVPGPGTDAAPAAGAGAGPAAGGAPGGGPGNGPASGPGAQLEAGAATAAPDAAPAPAAPGAAGPGAPAPGGAAPGGAGPGAAAPPRPGQADAPDTARAARAGAAASGPDGTAAGAAPAAAPDETLAEARRSEAALSRAEREALQVALQWKGFYAAAIDGVFGPGTRAAMSAWQAQQGHEATGVLTTAQRAELLRGYEAEIAALGLETVRDTATGISVTLPLALVAFDRYDPPFAWFAPRNGSGVTIRLVSQAGDGGTLAALYEALLAAPEVPPDGPRKLGPAGFTIRGIDGGIETFHAAVQLRDGLVKGYIAAWSPAAAHRMPRVLDMMRSSFAVFGGYALDAGDAAPLALDRAALLAGIEERTPLRARSGVFVDAAGAVLTAAEAVAGCGRITLEAAHPAEVALIDVTLGVALVRPRVPLAPRGVAGFVLEAPAPGPVAAAGFPWGEVLPRPVLTWGRLAAAGGLDGAPGRARLDLAPEEGDIGGPVLDQRGAVLGILLPAPEDGRRVLPPGVAELALAAPMAPALAAAGLRLAAPAAATALPAEDLARLADRITALVTCWP